MFYGAVNGTGTAATSHVSSLVGQRVQLPSLAQVVQRLIDVLLSHSLIREYVCPAIMPQVVQQLIDTRLPVANKEQAKEESKERKRQKNAL